MILEAKKLDRLSAGGQALMGVKMETGEAQANWTRESQHKGSLWCALVPGLCRQALRKSLLFVF